MKTETLYYQEWEPSTLLGTCCSIQIWLDKVKYCKSRELLVTLNTITTYLMQPKQSYSEPPPPPPGSMLCGRSARDGRVPNIEAGGGGGGSQKHLYLGKGRMFHNLLSTEWGEKKIIYTFFQLHVVFESLLYLWERIPYLTATLDLV